MSKKKVSRQRKGASKQTQNPKVPATEHNAAALSRQSSMEDHDSYEEKLQNLKSLNVLLLKQTVEKRQQIESLVQVNNALEDELARSGSETTELRDELSRARQENVGLNLEMTLLLAFVESHFRGIGDEVNGLVKEKLEREDDILVLKREADELTCKLESEKERLCNAYEERDSIKTEFDLQKQETNRLRENVIGLEKKEVQLETEISKLKSKIHGMAEEKRTQDELIEQAKKEMIILEKALEGRAVEMKDTKREIEGLVSDKKKMEIEVIDKAAYIDDLKEKLNHSNEIVQNLQKEKGILQELVTGLEKNRDEALEKGKEMAMQIDVLVKGNAVKESEVDKLMKEMNLAEKQMETAMVEISEKEKLINVLSHEKNELEKLIGNQEDKLVELKRGVDDLNLAMGKLQNDCSAETKKSEKLIQEVSRLKEALVQAELVRDDSKKALNEEKINKEALKSKVSELEKTIEAFVKELEKSKNEIGSLIKEKEKMKIQSESLKKEKGNLERDNLSSKKAMSALKAELESAQTNEEHFMEMLKKTTSLLYQSENSKDGIISEQKPKKGVKPYVAELEAIKNVFRSKENIVEKMRKEVETMQRSVEIAHKRKSFWTIVSYATTILAAASIAYIVRIR